MMRVKAADESPARPAKNVQRNAPARRVNPEIVITIDATTKKRFWATSEVASLRALELTEAELYGEVTAHYPRYTRERIFREGAEILAKRKIAEAHSPKLRGQVTRPGSADGRLKTAYEQLMCDNADAVAAGEPERKITAYTLSETAIPITSWRTAAKWLRENHPPKPTRSRKR